MSLSNPVSTLITFCSRNTKKKEEEEGCRRDSRDSRRGGGQSFPKGPNVLDNLPFSMQPEPHQGNSSPGGNVTGEIVGGLLVSPWTTQGGKGLMGIASSPWNRIFYQVSKHSVALLHLNSNVMDTKA